MYLTSLKDCGAASRGAFDRKVLRVVTDASRRFLRGEKHVAALILTGSIARGEGSFIEAADGRARLLGDVEFLLVSESPERERAVAAGLEAALSEALLGEGIHAPVDVGTVRPDYFDGIRPHIFGVELKAHGKVVAGDRSIMERMPEFGPRDIPRWDAIHLLFNRMVEQMIALEGLLHGDAEDIRNAYYQNIKLTVDMGGSLLAFQRRYLTTYRERARAVEPALYFVDHAGTRERLSTLPLEVKSATAVKLNPSIDPVLSWNGTASRMDWYRRTVLRRWLDLVDRVRTLWGWEMNRHLDGPWTDETEELLQRYLKRERLASRMRGWAKWMLRSRGKGYAPYMQLLRSFPAGSPRALIYAAAAMVYFSSPQALAGDDGVGHVNEANRALEMLPHHGKFSSSDWTSACRCVVESWKEHVKDG